MSGSDYTNAAPAFPWPRFEGAALLGVILAALGLGVILAARSRRVRFGARERMWYQYGGAAIIVIGAVIATWFSTVAVPLTR